MKKIKFLSHVLDKFYFKRDITLKLNVKNLNETILFSIFVIFIIKCSFLKFNYVYSDTYLNFINE